MTMKTTLKRETAKQQFLKTRREMQRKNEKELIEALNDPDRKAKESLFAEKHRDDSDEELLIYLKNEKKKMRGRFKRKRFIGYSYYVERFGSWENAAKEANRMLREETEAEKEKE